uniref:jupiter microtubule associated homolog 2-like n=1 Tax=Pristiophorus japonicus TaxID=55135 RepID=UPI00398F7A5E
MTTITYQGLDSTGCRSTSRVLQPPAGGSSISFGMVENVKPVHSRSNKTASNIFGPPVESQPVARRSNPPGGKSSGIFGVATTDTPDPKRWRNPPGCKTSGIFVTVKKNPNTLGLTGEDEKCPGSSNSETEEEAQGKKAEFMSSPVTPAQPASFWPRKIPSLSPVIVFLTQMRLPTGRLK